MFNFLTQQETVYKCSWRLCSRVVFLQWYVDKTQYETYFYTNVYTLAASYRLASNQRRQNKISIITMISKETCHSRTQRIFEIVT